MGTVLLTYEFGAGLGHLTPLISVARRLSPNHRLVFHMPSVQAAEGAIRNALGDRAEVRQGTTWRMEPGAPEVSATLADPVWAGGFGAREQVREKAEFWRRTIADLQPDLIICDFAPALRLAVADSRPMIEVGYGYTVPPAGRLLPPLRPWESKVPADSRMREFDMLSQANAIRASFGGPPVDHFGDLFHGDLSFVCTLPQFDMYGAFRTEPQLAPLISPTRCGPAFADRSQLDVFLYLHASHPRLDDLLAALTATGLRAGVYVSGGARVEAISARCGGNVVIFRKPADYARVLPQTRLVIHHGGLGTSHTALAAGTPQLMFPTRLEWIVNARAVEGLGAGRRADAGLDRDGLTALIGAMVQDVTLQANALNASAMLRDVLRTDPLARIAEACEWRLPQAQTGSAENGVEAEA